jgi:hypothetical protein
MLVIVIPGIRPRQSRKRRPARPRGVWRSDAASRPHAGSATHFGQISASLRVDLLMPSQYSNWSSSCSTRSVRKTACTFNRRLHTGHNGMGSWSSPRPSVPERESEGLASSRHTMSRPTPKPEPIVMGVQRRRNLVAGCRSTVAINLALRKILVKSSGESAYCGLPCTVESSLPAMQGCLGVHITHGIPPQRPGGSRFQTLYEAMVGRCVEH